MPQITTFNNDPHWLYRMLGEVQESYFVPEGLETALDLGMNVGAFSLLHARHFEHIWGFEPAHDTFHVARKLIDAFDIQNVTPYQLAVIGDPSGHVRNLYQPDSHRRSGNARLYHQWEQCSNYESCYSIGINEVCYNVYE